LGRKEQRRSRPENGEPKKNQKMKGAYKGAQFWHNSCKQVWLKMPKERRMGVQTKRQSRCQKKARKTSLRSRISENKCTNAKVWDFNERGGGGGSCLFLTLTEENQGLGGGKTQKMARRGTGGLQDLVRWNHIWGGTSQAGRK